MNKSELFSRLSIQSSDNSEPGGKIIVGLIDGSIDTAHPDLLNADISLIEGEACQSKESEGCRHGTFMAGIIVAAADSEAPALCPSATLVARPIFCNASDLNQCPLVSEDHLIDALQDCLNKGVKIINLSLGMHDQSHRVSEKLTKLYDTAKQQGVLIIAASGNQGADDVSPLFRHPWVIPVAASNHANDILPSSNKGDFLVRQGLLAPGDDIASLRPESGCTTMSGTSVAAAITSGVAARLWAQYPNASADEIRIALLRPDETQRPVHLNALLSTQYLSGIQPASTCLTEEVKHPVNFVTPLNSPTLTQENQLVMQSVENEIMPQSCSCGGLGGGCSCSGNDVPKQRHIYAVGIIKPVFPSLDLEKEFNSAAEALGVAESDFYSVFSATNNPYGYIAEQMSWVLVINNINVYSLVPRSQIELNDIINSLKPAPVPTDEVLSVAIGFEQGTGPASMTGGLTLPLLVCNQVYYFTLAELTKNFSTQNINTEAIADVIKTIEFKPNDGASAEDRAINYLAFRYPEIYRKTASMKDASNNPTGESHFLVGIETKMSAISSDRQLVDVIFKYQSKTSGEQSFWYCSVDVTGQFPFLNTPLRTYVPIKQ
ncbi:MAG: S8 family serine peptidase [Aestuariibacter sp.]